MQAKRVFGVVSSAILVFLAACGDDDDSDAIHAFIHDYCSLHEGVCCTQTGKTYDGDSCELLFSFASGTFDQANADACIAGLKAAQSTPTYCSDKGGADVSAKCNNAFKASGGGSAAAGAACNKDGDCAAVANAEVECTFTSSSTNGATSSSQTCRVYIHGAAGADCTGDRVEGKSGSINSSLSSDATTTVCWEADGFYCSNSTKKCTARGALGDKCSTSDNKSCPADAYCAQKEGGSFDDQVCVARAKLDEACEARFENTCVDGLHCDQNAKKCATDTPDGGPCDDSNPSCGAGAFCIEGKCSADGGFALFCK